VHTKQSDQAHLVLGVPSYPIAHPDRYVLQVLATVLGGGMSSRLFTEVRERRGLAYYVYGMNHSYTDAGSLYAQAGVDINRVDEAVTTIVLQLENPQGLILFGLRREVLEGEAAEPDDVMAAIDAVTADDVQRVAQDLITQQRLHLALIGPFDDAERFETLLVA
jgi:predicted Zn-dependent peptidase